MPHLKITADYGVNTHVVRLPSGHGDETITNAVVVQHGYQSHMFVDTESGARGSVFAYYPDELYFMPEEVIGKTVTQAQELHMAKDTKFLQS